MDKQKPIGEWITENLAWLEKEMDKPMEVGEVRPIKPLSNEDREIWEDLRW